MCGILGVIGPQNAQSEETYWASMDAYHGILTLQHRGQDAAGILSYDQIRKNFNTHKDSGLIASVLTEDILKTMTGNCAIAHTRYATVGKSSKNDLQPVISGFPLGTGMIHNGNILNYHTLSDEIKEDANLQLLTTNDIEIILNLWNYYLLQVGGLEGKLFTIDRAKQAVSKIFDKIIGGYAVLAIIAGEGLLAFRDPKGIRPAVLGRKKTGNTYKYCVCSETVALNYLGYEYLRDLFPGEFLFIDNDCNIHSEVLIKETPARCMFEWIYFSAAESTIANKGIYSARLDVGTLLGKQIKNMIESGEMNPDVVVAVPDTSRPSAIALAEEIKIPYRESLIKNRYVQRSFILDSQDAREKAVRLKLSPVKSEIVNKNILLVDDSIVRGTTSKRIISLLKEQGAKKVYVASGCPPISYPCYYGIDFPNREELIAHNRTPEEIADRLGADKVIYLEMQNLTKSLEQNDLCLACLNGKYPTCIKDGEDFAKRRGK